MNDGTKYYQLMKLGHVQSQHVPELDINSELDTSFVLLHGVKKPIEQFPQS